MHVVCRTFHAPKKGATEAEYEDAAFPFGGFDGRCPAFRCAIADGATESSFAREWARALVRHFGVGTLTRRNRHRVIPDLQRRWCARVSRRPLPWFAEEAASRGAFAAFLGLTLHDLHGQSPSRIWRAFAIGDACLFVVRGDRLRRAFPMDRADQFNSRPFLLSTRRDKWPEESMAIGQRSGEWQPGDEFYLATDALAHWVLSENEGKWKPWDVLRMIERSELPFREFVDLRRGDGSLRNDDTTLLSVRVSQ